MNWVKISLVGVTAAVTAGVALAYWYGMIFNPTPSEQVNAASVYDFTLKDIDGNDVKLDKYKGSVVMIVNTASRCGYTPQYDGLTRATSFASGCSSSARATCSRVMPSPTFSSG